MRIQSQDIIVTLDPLSYASGYKVLGGSIRQVYDVNESSYNPSRKMSPLVIMPWIASKDNSEIQTEQVTFIEYDEETGEAIGEQTVERQKGRMTGGCELSGVVYQLYRYRNSAWSVETVGTDVSGESQHKSNVVFDEVDADVPDAPKHSLVFKDDIPAEESAYIHVIAYTVDRQDGMEKSQEFDITLTTDTVQEEFLELKPVDGEIPTRQSYDPLRSGVTTFTRGAQLYRNGESVADSRAVYFWYVRGEDGWELLTPDNEISLLWLKTAFDASGRLPKQITIDLSFFDVLNLKVMAAYWDAGATKPSAPDNGRCPDAVYYSMRRQLARETVGEVLSVEGIKVTPDAKVVRQLLLRDNRGDLTSAEIQAHYVIEWWKKRSSDTVESYVSTGDTLESLASDLGVTPSNSVSLCPRVFAKRCYKPVADDDGSYVIDDDGSYVVAQDEVRV